MIYVVRIAAGRAVGSIGLLLGAIGVAMISLGYSIEGTRAEVSYLND